MFKKIAFFVGSGISYCSNVPSVEQLTKEILESAWFLHTDQWFYPAPEKDAPNDELMQEKREYAHKVQKFIWLIYEHIYKNVLSKEGRPPNYEDICGCLNQILQDETVEIVNPLIACDIDILKAKSADLWLSLRPQIDNNRFATLASQAADLIECAVCYLLSNKKPKGLDLFVKAKEIFDEVDIFTLNHDTLIEQQFDNAKILYVDGFGKNGGDVKWFDSIWDQNSSSVRLFKLHGSVNWLRINNKYAKILKGSYDSLKDSEGKRIGIPASERNILTGIIIKEQHYGHEPFIELFAQFHNRLKEHKLLFISGYGWGDHGINVRIAYWLAASKNNKIVIFHKNGEADISGKKFWGNWRWTEFHDKSDQVTVIPKWLCECSLDDIQKYFK